MANPVDHLLSVFPGDHGKPFVAMLERVLDWGRDPAAAAAAQDALQAEEAKPGVCFLLAYACVQGSDGVRMLAGTQLKNVIARRWMGRSRDRQSQDIPAEEKDFVRQFLLSMVRELNWLAPLHQLLCVALSQVARTDWPDAFPDLMPSLLSGGATPATLSALYRVLKVLARRRLMKHRAAFDTLPPQLLPFMIGALAPAVDRGMLQEACAALSSASGMVPFPAVHELRGRVTCARVMFKAVVCLIAHGWKGASSSGDCMALLEKLYHASGRALHSLQALSAVALDPQVADEARRLAKRLWTYPFEYRRLLEDPAEDSFIGLSASMLSQLAGASEDAVLAQALLVGGCDYAALCVEAEGDGAFPQATRLELAHLCTFSLMLLKDGDLELYSDSPEEFHAAQQRCIGSRGAAQQLFQALLERDAGALCPKVGEWTRGTLDAFLRQRAELDGASALRSAVACDAALTCFGLSAASSAAAEHMDAREAVRAFLLPLIAAVLPMAAPAAPAGAGDASPAALGARVVLYRAVWALGCASYRLDAGGLSTSFELACRTVSAASDAGDGALALSAVEALSLLSGDWKFDALCAAPLAGGLFDHLARLALGGGCLAELPSRQAVLGLLAALARALRLRVDPSAECEGASYEAQNLLLPHAGALLELCPALWRSFEDGGHAPLLEEVYEVALEATASLGEGVARGDAGALAVLGASLGSVVLPLARLGLRPDANGAPFLAREAVALLHFAVRSSPDGCGADASGPGAELVALRAALPALLDAAGPTAMLRPLCKLLDGYACLSGLAPPQETRIWSRVLGDVRPRGAFCALRAMRQQLCGAAAAAAQQAERWELGAPDAGLEASGAGAARVVTRLYLLAAGVQGVVQGDGGAEDSGVCGRYAALLATLCFLAPEWTLLRWLPEAQGLLASGRLRGAGGGLVPLPLTAEMQRPSGAALEELWGGAAFEAIAAEGVGPWEKKACALGLLKLLAASAAAPGGCRPQSVVTAVRRVGEVAMELEELASMAKRPEVARRIGKATDWPSAWRLEGLEIARHFEYAGDNEGLSSALQALMQEDTAADPLRTDAAPKAASPGDLRLRKALVSDPIDAADVREELARVMPAVVATLSEQVVAGLLRDSVEPSLLAAAGVFRAAQ